MPIRIQDGKLLYHVTAVENLENIFKHGLLSRKDADSKKLLEINIADQEIIKKRKELGILQYVPFHFYEKTPFTGKILKKYSGTTFCIIAIRRKTAKDNNFKICTAHPLSQNPIAEVLDYEEGFHKIDWENAEKRDYDDPISKNACMAECLAVSPVMPKDFHAIFVADKQTEDHVRLIVSKILKERYNFKISTNESFFKV